MAGTDPSPDPRFAPGDRVEVRNNFDGHWARGFEIVEPGADGYRIRRLSDGGELPRLFLPDDVRAEKPKRRSGTWWY